MIYRSPIIPPGPDQFLIWSADFPSPLLSILGIRLIVFYTTILGHFTYSLHKYSIIQIFPTSKSKISPEIQMQIDNGDRETIVAKLQAIIKETCAKPDKSQIHNNETQSKKILISPRII